jgi:4-diphosphocytidyl-2-C-methyl-D-erythritol kinase
MLQKASNFTVKISFNYSLMISFPNCKINLGLHITGKRADGFHDLESVFYPINIKDVIEIIPSVTFQFTVTGLPVEGKADDNLCVKAYYLLKKDFPGLPIVSIWLHKHIPIGAGLGGGSGDAAFTLALLNKKFNLRLSDSQLIGYASQLGSDCPFFILNNPCYATGRGEILEPTESDLSQYSIVLVHPEIQISTAWAFSRIIPQTHSKAVKEIISQPISTWKDELKNDFEVPVLKEYPQLQVVKEKLYQAGALYASMTGSGSSFFGLFPSKPLLVLSMLNNYQLTFL